MSTSAPNSLSSTIHTVSAAPVPQGALSTAPERARTLPSPAAAKPPDAGGTRRRRGVGVASSPVGKSPSEEAVIDFITVAPSPVEINPLSPRNSCSGPASPRTRSSQWCSHLEYTGESYCCLWKRKKLMYVRGDVGHPRARHRKNFPLMATDVEALQGPLFGEGDCG